MNQNNPDSTDTKDEVNTPDKRNSKAQKDNLVTKQIPFDDPIYQSTFVATVPAPKEAPSVTRRFDEDTGRHYLQGRETADADRANVFGDADYKPAGYGLHSRVLVYEVEVLFRFSEGTIEDYAEVHSFWAKAWHDTPTGPQAELLIDGEDFCAYHEDTWEVWAGLLRIAVKRISNARHNQTEFEPVLVGGPEDKRRL